MIETIIVAAIGGVIGVAVLAAPVLDLIVFGATLPARFGAWRAGRAAKRARRKLAELQSESRSHPHDRDWHA